MAVITVIGAGNGAHALAADCKLGGAEVRMFEFTRYNNKVKGILNSRRIRLEGLEMNYEHFKRSGTAVLDMVTYDMAEAVHGADHILISVQAQGFQQVFEELAPLLEDGQTVRPPALMTPFPPKTVKQSMTSTRRTAPTAPTSAPTAVGGPGPTLTGSSTGCLPMRSGLPATTAAADRSISNTMDGSSSWTAPMETSITMTTFPTNSR